MFDEKTTIIENWVQGNRYAIEKINPLEIKGTYELTITSSEGKNTYDFTIEGDTAKPEAKISQGSLVYGSKISYNEPWVTLLIKSKDTLTSKFSRLTGIKNEIGLSGKAILEDGTEGTWEATPKKLKPKRRG